MFGNVKINAFVVPPLTNWLVTVEGSLGRSNIPL
jgi:hypothetical protein